jgi:hypothetical protein
VCYSIIVYSNDGPQEGNRPTGTKSILAEEEEVKDSSGRRATLEATDDWLGNGYLIIRGTVQRHGMKT